MDRDPRLDPRLDPQLADLLALIEAAPYPPMEEGSVADARRGFRGMTVDLVTPDQVIEVGSVEEAEVATRPARIYRPHGSGTTPTVAYFHGGGFVVGDLDTHDQACRRLCRDTGAVVVSVDYRLAPEHPWPAAVDDCLAATEWTADHLAELGGGRLGVAGDSAGGNLSAVAAQTLRERVSAQLLVYPAVHVLGDYSSRTENADGYLLTETLMAWFMSHYAATVEGVDLDDPTLSPLLGELAGVPPAVIATAQFDPLRDEGEAYAAALTAAGVPVDLVRYDGMIHGFADMVAASTAAERAVADLHGRFARLLRG